jgi:ketosteroid isomerase-like protein
MKCLLAIGIVSMAVLLSCTSTDQQAAAGTAQAISAPAPDNAAPAQLEKLERDWIAAIVAKDTATLERLLADDFAGTTNEQRYSKADAIEDVKTGTHESLQLEDVEVRVFGDTAVATMVQNEKSRHDNEDFSGRYFFTNVWVKRNGEWRAVASHGSRAR